MSTLVVYRVSHYYLAEQAGEQVRHYVDKLLEEVDEAQASALRAAEMDVTRREGSLKAMRAEVRVLLFLLGACSGWSRYLCQGLRRLLLREIVVVPSCILVGCALASRIQSYS
jgi:hypothetical protein